MLSRELSGRAAEIMGESERDDEAGVERSQRAREQAVGTRLGCKKAPESKKKITSGEAAKRPGYHVLCLVAVRKKDREEK